MLVIQYYCSTFPTKHNNNVGGIAVVENTQEFVDLLYNKLGEGEYFSYMILNNVSRGLHAQDYEEINIFPYDDILHYGNWNDSKIHISKNQCLTELNNFYEREEL